MCAQWGPPFCISDISDIPYGHENGRPPLCLGDKYTLRPKISFLHFCSGVTIDLMYMVNSILMHFSNVLCLL